MKPSGKAVDRLGERGRAQDACVLSGADGSSCTWATARPLHGEVRDQSLLKAETAVSGPPPRASMPTSGFQKST